ncbi:unnamed protein product [Cladocopium goreaui]|uniref:VWFA domain-containing protein n=1 Tax=Cladocopium goreaui TaxID=2562237 RepID=A0A9P1G174_9DINO|nr:unnamed protein product [Cladocopium goreaui]
MQPEPEPVDTAIGASVALGTPGADGVPVLVSVEPPPGSARTASDICCVVDVSGSMSNDALLQGEDGTMWGAMKGLSSPRSTSHGLSVLDIVKHALRTIIANLDDFDRLACVSYSNSAKEIFPLTTMTDNGRRLTESKLDDLHADGMTNLWDGLQSGLQLLKNGQDGDHSRRQHILLFTDGMPNINPPRGILPMLKRLKEKSEGRKLPCTVSTFGFGYELDSALLNDLAMEGFGAYAFIPDAGFVGTVFVNAMSNLLATMARDVVVTLRSTRKMTVLGGHQISQNEVTTIDLGTLQFGQTKDVVVMLDGEGEVEAMVEYLTPTGPGRVAARGGADPSRVEPQRLRLKAVDSIQQAMNALKLTAMDRANGKPLPLEDADGIIKAMVSEIKTSTACNEEAMTGLLEDLDGQDCAQRQGGAFITLQIGAGSTAQHTLQWLEDDTFINVAIKHATGTLRGSRKKGAIPIFNRVLNGTDCDETWSWHVDPKEVSWAEVATEVCDASPGYIEKNSGWLTSPGKWCPWTVSVLRVEDRRSAQPQLIESKGP